MKVKVSHDILTSNDRTELVKILAGIIEARRNRGDQIIALLPFDSSAPYDGPQFGAVIFSEHEVNQ